MLGDRKKCLPEPSQEANMQNTLHIKTHQKAVCINDIQ